MLLSILLFDVAMYSTDQLCSLLVVIQALEYVWQAVLTAFLHKGIKHQLTAIVDVVIFALLFFELGAFKKRDHGSADLMNCL